VRAPAPFRLAAPLLIALVAAGCAPSRVLLTGPERDQAERFFAGLPGGVSFPVKATFSGVAEPMARDAIPFVAGVNAPSPSEEVVGVYDPLGRGVLFLANDGRRVDVTRGPAADLAGFRGASALWAGSLSIARVLSGAPGYPVEGGEAARQADGGWSLEEERQVLYTDPGRKFLAGALYRLPGMTVEVSYPDRDSTEPPRRLAVAVRGVKITLRRDEE